MDTNTYHTFLQSKRIVVSVQGKLGIGNRDVHPLLFDFQRDLTVWALRKGRAAIFADTGLGKTLMQLEWARLIGGRTLIIAPLSVAKQTVREANKLGLDVYYTRSGNDLKPGINITNYEMVGKFNPNDFNAVVLDESSILKALTGKTRRKLTDMFSATPYRLCCTATPAPNDIAEIANHAEFLGVMTRANMLAAFFVNDDDGWRLRGHAEQAFYRWMASWGMSVKKPSDLGYDDGGFILPPLNVQTTFVPSDWQPEGMLFFTGLKGIGHRSQVRRGTLHERVAATAKLVNGSNQDQWIVWCGLNDEADMMTGLVHDAVQVKGGDKLSYKVDTLEAFQDGNVRVLVTKPRIAGFGMNFQNAHKMAFVGLSDSWEAYYQCTRRCWRFMQKHPVDVHIVLSELEDGIWRNVQQKERQAEHMSERLIEFVKEYERAELMETEVEGYEYGTDEASGEGWRLLLGDSVERLGELEDESIDLSVFSPPFMDLYSYTPTERDLGNSHTQADFFEHFGYIINHLLRVTKPGRLCVCHSADVPAMLGKDGYIGLKDFPGKVIVAFEERGWIYHGRVTIDKNPQAQAIRTHSKALLFVQMRKDSTWSRPAIGDSLLIFRKPGDNAVPVTPVENDEMDNETWIEWAHPIWYGIRETKTLQYRTARGPNDDKHICPLQLDTIERCIRLWSNPNELVLSPFAGIGSEGYKAVMLGRQFVGIELKRSYYDEAVRNLEKASAESQRDDLFAWAERANGTRGG